MTHPKHPELIDEKTLNAKVQAAVAAARKINVGEEPTLHHWETVGFIAPRNQTIEALNQAAKHIADGAAKAGVAGEPVVIRMPNRDWIGFVLNERAIGR